MQRLMAYVCKAIPNLTDEAAAEVERAIRGEFGGERVYIPAKTMADRRLRTARQVLRLFNGCNATEVARELNVGRATVYRVLKQAGEV